jgi:hypothetical protein
MGKIVQEFRWEMREGGIWVGRLPFLGKSGSKEKRDRQQRQKIFFD